MRYTVEGNNGFEMTIKEENIDYFANSQNEEEHENNIIPEIKEENFDVETVHEKKKRFKCTDCNKCFGYRNVLNNHIKSIHEKRKPYKCDICNGQFKLEHNLKAHIKAVHEGIKPFSCTICKATFKSKPGLSQHIETVHEGKKPFECPICEARFSQKGDANRHIQEKHKENFDNLQKFQCNECGKSCLDEIEFGNHKLYHKSLEIVSCVKCHENIMRKSVKIHLKNVHDMEIDPEATWVQGKNY
jgi:uncharacterized Zn-finger protein